MKARILALLLLSASLACDDSTGPENRINGDWHLAWAQSGGPVVAVLNMEGGRPVEISGAMLPPEDVSPSEADVDITPDSLIVQLYQYRGGVTFRGELDGSCWAGWMEATNEERRGFIGRKGGPPERSPPMDGPGTC